MRNQIKRLRLISIIALVLAATEGCSNTTEANNTNFKKAINDYFDKSPACVHVFGAHNMPDTIEVSPYTQLTTTEYDNFARLGLLQVTEGEIQKSDFLRSSYKVKTKTYALTEEGKKYYGQDKIQRMGISNAGTFCYGKRSVVAINNFSAPANMMGQTVSDVHFTYEISDLAPWTKDPQVRAKFKEIERTTAGPNKGSATLVKTDKGWVHQALFTQ